MCQTLCWAQAQRGGRGDSHLWKRPNIRGKCTHSHLVTKLYDEEQDALREEMGVGGYVLDGGAEVDEEGLYVSILFLFFFTSTVYQCYEPALIAFNSNHSVVSRAPFTDEGPGRSWLVSGRARALAQLCVILGKCLNPTDPQSPSSLPSLFKEAREGLWCWGE